MTPRGAGADCGAAAPRNCDTAVFTFPIADYAIVLNANGTLTVTDIRPAAGHPPGATDGTDTLRNIEQLQFTDATAPSTSRAGRGRWRDPHDAVPNVVGLTQAAATTTLTNADFVTDVDQREQPDGGDRQRHQPESGCWHTAELREHREHRRRARRARAERGRCNAGCEPDGYRGSRRDGWLGHPGEQRGGGWHDHQPVSGGWNKRAAG